MAVSIVSAVILVQQPADKPIPQVIEPEKQSDVQINKREVQCVRQALWHEARGEGEEGIKAVLSVIVNRTKSKHYPDTFCEVIHQPKQFSYVDELRQQGKPLTPKVKESEQEVYSYIDELAHEAVQEKFVTTLPRDVLWYTHTRINNYWTRTKEVVARVGKHKFFAKKEKQNVQNAS